jgi:poly(hydroxyalkanoate) granule-associated protein
MSKTATALVDRISNEQILTTARESARKLWLCGLGAYSLATKSSIRTFEALMRQGQAIKPKARQQIEEKSAELRSTASTTIERGEQLVKKRLLRPLDFVLLATRHDVEQLSLRVIQLSSEVHNLASGASRSMVKPLSKPAAKAAATHASPMPASAS